MTPDDLRRMADEAEAEASSCLPDLRGKLLALAQANRRAASLLDDGRTWDDVVRMLLCGELLATH